METLEQQIVSNQQTSEQLPERVDGPSTQPTLSTEGTLDAQNSQSQVNTGVEESKTENEGHSQFKIEVGGGRQRKPQQEQPSSNATEDVTMIDTTTKEENPSATQPA